MKTPLVQAATASGGSICLSYYTAYGMSTIVLWLVHPRIQLATIEVHMTHPSASSLFRALPS